MLFIISLTGPSQFTTKLCPKLFVTIGKKLINNSQYWLLPKWAIACGLHTRYRMINTDKNDLPPETAWIRTMIMVYVDVLVSSNEYCIKTWCKSVMGIYFINVYLKFWMQLSVKYSTTHRPPFQTWINFNPSNDKCSMRSMVNTQHVSTSM